MPVHVGRLEMVKRKKIMRQSDGVVREECGFSLLSGVQKLDIVSSRWGF